MKKRMGSWVYWSPRILSILFICFLSIFAFDVFENGNGFWGTALALSIHLIPSFILILTLLISWRYEIIGAVMFFLGGLIYILFGGFIFVPIWLIAFLIGFLFFWNWIKK